MLMLYQMAKMFLLLVFLSTLKRLEFILEILHVFTTPSDNSKKLIDQIEKITQLIIKKLKIIGFINIQYAIKDEKVYVLEVNPRASRTVPFISKSIGVPLANIATKIMLGSKLKDFLDKKKIPVFC